MSLLVLFLECTPFSLQLEKVTTKALMRKSFLDKMPILVNRP